jgi:hypothetical protein
MREHDHDHECDQCGRRADDWIEIERPAWSGSYTNRLCSADCAAVWIERIPYEGEDWRTDRCPECNAPALERHYLTEVGPCTLEQWPRPGLRDELLELLP